MTAMYCPTLHRRIMGLDWHALGLTRKRDCWFSYRPPDEACSTYGFRPVMEVR